VNTSFTNINISVGTLNVNTSSNDTLMLGGIAGLLLEGSSISGCSMTGDMEGSGGSSGGFDIFDIMAGGLAGMMRYGEIIENCYVSGNISARSTTSSGVKAGGLAGQFESYVSSAVIQKSYSTGNINAVSAAGKARAGGIAETSYNSGSGNDSKITDCYSTGTISASGAGSTEVGGIAGHCTMEGSASTGATLTIEHCYASGNISAAGSSFEKEAGSIAGSAKQGYGSGSITNCAALSGSVVGDTAYRVVADTNFSLNNIANKDMKVNGNPISPGSVADSVNGADKTAAELELQATYTGWDFINVWKMQGGRPILKWQP
jgi:hypothetical protein